MMLAVNQLVGFGARRAPPPAAGGSYSFLQGIFSSTDTSAVGFSSVNLGAADDARDLVIFLTYRQQSSLDRTISSLTVGSVSATRLLAITTSGSFRNCICYAINGGAGSPLSGVTAADIVVSASGNINSWRIALYRVVGVGSILTPYDTAAVAGANLTGIDIPANGLMLAGRYNGGASDVVWNPAEITTDFHERTSLHATDTGSRYESAGATGLTLTRPGGTNSNDGAVALTWAFV